MDLTFQKTLQNKIYRKHKIFGFISLKRNAFKTFAVYLIGMVLTKD